MTRGLWRAGVLVVFALAGCATSPEGVVKDGARFDFDSAHTPYAAAICITRNARAMGGGITGEERLLGDSSTEVAVRPSAGASDTLATAQVHRVGALSRISVYTGRGVRGDPRAFAAKLVAGC